ncbi:MULTISPECIES: hypothetical protein [unclassified Pseudoclavibacter]|uniref:hypothetical protein n=1 Tax=unclassified Pseudoclavibacter TaxID=2615177 RepID=UPI001BAB1D48|nr:hypothetical protein [Pseudoclavibacter sp. Marseille-Q4354]MBS3177763.1 hypothetical protein [Pseudoclavibacter sp. Marseille-Q4354]
MTDLSVGGGGGVMDPRKFDVTSGVLRKRGTVVGHSTFENGTDGWVDHFHYADAATVISRTRRHPFHGSKALLVSPSELPYSQATRYHGASAYKRVGWPKEVGPQSLSGWFAIRAGSGANLLTERKYPFSQMWIGMDSQLPDGTSRAFGTVSLRDNGDGSCSWWLKGGKRGTGSTAETRPDIEIAGTRMWFTGLNENKANAFYTRLTTNPASMFAGGDYYLEFQVNGKVFDLRGLTGIPYDLLLNNGSHDMFTGGNNIGMGIARSSVNQEQNVVQLLADEILFTTNDRIGA